MSISTPKSRTTWRGIFLAALAVGLLTFCHTIFYSADPNDEVQMAQDIVKNLSAAKELSEDYILQSEVTSLESIEDAFDNRMAAIDRDLHTLSKIDNPRVNLIVAELFDLRVHFRDDAKRMMRAHKAKLLCDVSGG